MYGIICLHILLVLAPKYNAEPANKSNRQVIFDASDILREGTKDQLLWNTASNKSREAKLLQGFYTVYYETDLSDNVFMELEGVATFFMSIMENEQKLFISLRHTTYSRAIETKIYSHIARLTTKYAPVIDSISISMAIEDTTIQGCSNQNQISKINISTLKKNLPTSIKIGYIVDYNFLNCEIHAKNIEQADNLIVNLTLSINDNVFVESFGMFKENMNNIINNINQNFSERRGRNTSHSLYIKVNLKPIQRSENLTVYFLSYYNGYAHVTFGERETQLLLKSSLKVLNRVDVETTNTYKSLLEMYLKEWLKTEDMSIQIIFKNSNFQEISDKSQWLNSGAHIIPYITDLANVGDIKGTAYGVRLQESASMLLEDVAASGFENIMVNGKNWKRLEETSQYLQPCEWSGCRPKNVIYVVDEPIPVTDPKNIDRLQNFGEMNVNAVYFSSIHGESLEYTWFKIRKDFLETFKSNHVPSFYMACYVHDIILNNLDTRCNEACMGNILRHIQGCSGITYYVSAFVWRITVQFRNYNVDQFVNLIMKRFDSFVIGRQMLNHQLPYTRIVLHIAGEYVGYQDPKPGLYCSSLGAKINQFYEAILTGAKINNFVIVLEPAVDTRKNFGNPLFWEKLAIHKAKTESQRKLKLAMESGPIFLRRRYSQTKVFGAWTDGMYPCITKASDPADIQKANFANDFLGVTVNFGIRQVNTSYTENEITTLLIMPLYEFQSIEIVLDSNIDTLREVMGCENFKRNLKQNGIHNRTVYLTIQDAPSNGSFYKQINNLARVLHKTGFKVGITLSEHLKYDVAHLQKKKFTKNVGLVYDDCPTLAFQIVFQNRSRDEYFKKVHYLVCNMEPILADNTEDTIMQDFFNSHVYLSKLFKYFYPNIKHVTFRLQALYNETDLTLNTMKLLRFLTDVNSFAQAYAIKYIVLPAFVHEAYSGKHVSYWKITDYTDLTNISVFKEIRAEFLNGTITTKPVISFTHNETSTPFKNISIETELSSSTNQYDIITSTTRTNQESTSSNTNIGKPETSSPYINISSENNSQEHPEESSTIWEQFMALPTAFYSIWSLLSIGLVFAAVVTFLVCRNRRRLTTKETNEFYKGKNEIIHKAAQAREHNRKYSGNFFNGLMYQQKYEVAKEDVVIDSKNVLNKGRFLITYRATLTSLQKDVFVYISKRRCSKDNFKGMLSDLKLLCYITEHPNLIRLIGCCTKDIQNCVVWVMTEFCETGTLLDYIRSVDKLFSKDVVLNLVRFGYEICSGMKYLADEDVTYGCLSAKQVLLDKSLTCKIKVFGLAGKLKEYKMLVKSKQMEKTPWQWMSPEAINQLGFSNKSDVWSFGITVWEIFSFGQVPYSGCASEFKFFESKIEQEAVTLERPSLATNEVYEIMLKCWQLNPARRPDFKYLLNCFSTLKPK